MNRRLMSRNRILAILSLLLMISSVSAATLEINKNTIKIGESVNITIRGYNEERLVVFYEGDNSTLNYLGQISDSIVFKPNKLGNYKISLVNSSGLVDEERFSVVEANIRNAKFVKESYSVGEAAWLKFSDAEDVEAIYLFEKDKRYVFLGEPKSPLKFMVTKETIYRVVIKYKDDEEIEVSFTSEPEEKPVETPYDRRTAVVVISGGAPDEKALLANKNFRKIDFDLNVMEVTEDKYSLEIFPASGHIRRINILDAVMKGNLSVDIGIDEVPTKKIMIEKKNVLAAFAVDPSAINFTNGIITAVAEGNELWKCQEWSFELQECSGSWSKIKDIAPGKEYSIALTPEDPGYAETGLASVNTNKSVYLPREDAGIIMVVLDTDGYLVSRAKVSLEIVSPSNKRYQYSTNAGTIMETERGIYEAIFTNIDEEGNYSMAVEATANNVNSTMISFFVVESYYEFDILRNTPVTIDPWQGPFNSEIKIVSYTNATTFDFIEMLPSNFTITNSTGATITENEDNKILTWSSIVNGTIVAYSALAPLVTPELYSFISLVQYEGKTFNEARPWFMAIDPIIQFENDEAVDVALAPLDYTSFVVMWGDEGGNEVYYSVYRPNGTVLTGPVTVRSDVGDNTLVTVGSFNSSNFAMALLWDDAGPNNRDDLEYAIYDRYGNSIVTATDADANVGGTKNNDAAIAVLNDRYVLCYANDNDDDADFQIFYFDGTYAAGETQIDNDMDPNVNLNNLISCAALNETRWVVVWHDDDSDTVRYEIRNEAGSLVSTDDATLAANTGANAQVDVAGLDGDKFVAVWYNDTTDDIEFTIRTKDDVLVAAGTDVDTDAGNTPRISVAAVRNFSESSDWFVVAWNDRTAGDIRAAIYDGSGTLKQGPFQVETDEDDTYLLIDVIGKDPVTGNEICP
ncbi:hypothetical protein JXA85_08695, partial [Candidatus Woesearchaeota archaeon]|nr:hypothetical protein [Candidatus Woesearchaeota archaeon]